MEYFAFQWHITEECDQQCKHCYIYALGSHAKFKEMNTDEMKTVLQNIQTFCKRLNRLPYLYLTAATRSCTRNSGSWPMLKAESIPFRCGKPVSSDGGCRRLKDFGCRKYQFSRWTVCGRPTTASAALALLTRRWPSFRCCGTPASTWR